MTSRTLKIGVTVTVLVVAFGALLYSSLSEGTEYYKHVDEVMADPSAWHGKRLQLHGFVVRDSILRRQHSLDYRFTIATNGKSVPVVYTGIVPDTFTDDAEVVLKGQLGPDGFRVDPNGIMAKCPSKYEPKKSAKATPAG